MKTIIKTRARKQSSSLNSINCNCSWRSCLLSPLLLQFAREQNKEQTHARALSGLKETRAIHSFIGTCCCVLDFPIPLSFSPAVHRGAREISSRRDDGDDDGFSRSRERDIGSVKFRARLLAWESFHHNIDAVFRGWRERCRRRRRGKMGSRRTER